MLNITVFFAFTDDKPSEPTRWLTIHAENGFKARLAARAAYPSRVLRIYCTVADTCSVCGSLVLVGQFCDYFDNNCQ